LQVMGRGPHNRIHESFPCTGIILAVAPRSRIAPSLWVLRRPKHIGECLFVDERLHRAGLVAALSGNRSRVCPTEEAIDCHGARRRHAAVPEPKGVVAARVRVPLGCVVLVLASTDALQRGNRRVNSNQHDMAAAAFDNAVVEEQSAEHRMRRWCNAITSMALWSDVSCQAASQWPRWGFGHLDVQGLALGLEE
jgi:hypothetical protein